MLLLFFILCSFAAIIILLLYPLFILTSSYCYSSFAFCQKSPTIVVPFSLLFIHFQLLLFSSYSSLTMLLFFLTFAHIHFNPLLLFVIIFYLIEHQTPCTHLFNFNYVFKVVAWKLQLLFWFTFKPWLATKLVYV
jgi:hypothetical protein